MEASLGALIVLLGTLMAVTAVERFWRHTRCDRLGRELLGFSAAFQRHELQHAAWPAATRGAKIISPGMESELKNTNWLGRTPVGGGYEWLYPYPLPNLKAGPSLSGAIAVTAFGSQASLKLSPADLLYLDAKIDDGNLATGNFRTGFNGWPVWLVSSRR
ncbi:MAG: hypothetical protein HZA31_12855 [Opitutae bacterium]|nr:hypothetical protein [Opitutae bacterium]